MAKKVFKNDNHSISPDELRDILAKAQAEQLKMNEHNGEKSSILRGAIDQWGLDRAALAFARKLSSFEESKRQATIRAFVEYAAKLGYLDQRDAFDDLPAFIGEAIKKGGELNEVTKKLIE